VDSPPNGKSSIGKAPAARAARSRQGFKGLVASGNAKTAKGQSFAKHPTGRSTQLPASQSVLARVLSAKPNATKTVPQAIEASVGGWNFSNNITQDSSASGNVLAMRGSGSRSCLAVTPQEFDSVRIGLLEWRSRELAAKRQLKHQCKIDASKRLSLLRKCLLGWRNAAVHGRGRLLSRFLVEGIRGFDPRSNSGPPLPASSSSGSKSHHRPATFMGRRLYESVAAPRVLRPV